MTPHHAFDLCLRDIEADMSRAVRKLSSSEGPNTAWLRANAAVTRRAYAEMLAEREGQADVA